MLFYSKDGNFHQCQHSKKMDLNDVPLSKGASYFAHKDDYADYLKSAKGTISDKEVGIGNQLNQCTGLNIYRHQLAATLKL